MSITTSARAETPRRGPVRASHRDDGRGFRRDRLLVVGTTPDYIALLDRAHPGRCLFLTDASSRAAAAEPAPDAEVVCSLGFGTDADGHGSPGAPPEAVRTALDRYLRAHEIDLVGIVCFDCESMPLAAALGEWLGLEYPTPRAIALARNKHAAVERWRRAGLPCPRSRCVGSEGELLAFRLEIDGPVVLKPLSGSGSELVFACRDEAECRAAFEILGARLREHTDGRMYAPLAAGEGLEVDARRPQAADEGVGRVDPRRVFVAEELVEGIELSCDFIVEDGTARIIRVCRKVAAAGQPIGTVGAYELLGTPAAVEALVGPPGALERQLAAAAGALGIDRAICVVDLIARDGELVMLEMAPRLAGDCLPELTRGSSGLDVLGLALDFAVGLPVAVPGPETWQSSVAVRFLASTAGTIKNVDIAAIRTDSRVVHVHCERRPGDVIVLPPESYDSRLLGYAIFHPAAGVAIERQCDELRDRLRVEIDPGVPPGPVLAPVGVGGRAHAGSRVLDAGPGN